MTSSLMEPIVKILTMNNYLVIGDSINSPWAHVAQQKEAMTGECKPSVRQSVE